MLALLRPEPAGTEDANALSAAGIQAMSLPMLEIRPALPDDIATQIAQASHLVFTSQAAIAAITARDDARNDTSTKNRDGSDSLFAGKACFCAGAATARAARQAGLMPLETSAGNAGELAEEISSAFSHPDKQIQAAPRLLWLSAETVGRDLVALLQARNIRMDRQVVYAADAVTSLSDEVRHLIASNQINAVLALSSRTLKIFQQLLTRYGLWHHHRQMHLIAGSEQIIASVTSDFATMRVINPAASQGYLAQLTGIFNSLPDS